jgi:hypothetical protein
MRFQVGRFTCEMWLDASGQVKVEWQPRRPLYLNPAERRQYQAGRKAFLESLEDHPSPGAQARRNTMNNVCLAIVATAALASVLTGGN